MCGIAGFLDPRRRRSDAESVDVLRAMTDVIWRRGPDGDGAWTDEAAGIGLGHRRLAIIDLSPMGHQPMASADERFVLTYNGEIYNHGDLADDLSAAGVRFRGHSDTEILIEAISRWGLTEALERSDGMFAFALWDRQERVLTLGRDRLGEKPLYYGTLGSGEVVFASTLDPITRHPAFDRPVDRDALTLFLRHKYVPAPWSIYEGIRKLEPGHTVTIAADGTVGTPVPYWSLYDVVERGATFTGTEAEAVDRLDELLHQSIRRRLVADVPVGAFLSGGIDSSTIVGIAQQESSVPVRTFTIGSTERDFDESGAARDIAAHLGTDHTERIVTGADALAVVDDLASTYDEPFADSSQIPTFLVSQLARSEVTVALSGDAGDELFGGYNRYTSVPSLWRRAESLPAGLRQNSARAAALVPPGWWDGLARAVPRNRRPQQVGLKVAKALDVVGSATPEDAYLRLVSHWQSPDAVVRRGSEPLTLHTDRSRWPSTTGIVDHMMAVDGVTYLPDDILTKVDRASMAVSLEGRIPLLDREIVEFAVSLPMSLKIRPGASKWVLRQVLDRYVPARLVDRPKSGFGLPIDDWLRGPLKAWAEDLLFGSDSAEFFLPDPIRSAWSSHQSGRANRAYDLWDVLMFASWNRRRVAQTALKA